MTYVIQKHDKCHEYDLVENFPAVESSFTFVFFIGMSGSKVRLNEPEIIRHSFVHSRQQNFC